MSNYFFLIVGWRPIAANRIDTLSKTKFDKLIKRVSVEPLGNMYKDKGYHIHSIQPISDNRGSYWMTARNAANSIVYADGVIKESRENYSGTEDTLHSCLFVGKYKVLFFEMSEAAIMDQDQLVCKLPFKLWSYLSHCSVQYCRHPFISEGKMYVIGNNKQLFRCNIQAINCMLSKDRKNEQKSETNLKIEDYVVLVDQDVHDCCVDTITGVVYYLTAHGRVMTVNKRLVYIDKTPLSCDSHATAIAAIGQSIVVASIINPDTSSLSLICMQLLNARGRRVYESSIKTASNHEYISYMIAFEVRRCRILVCTRVLALCDIYAIHGDKLHLIDNKMKVSSYATYSIWDLLVEVDKNKADIIFVGFEIFNRITISIK